MTMHESGKSDRPIVPRNPPNKGRGAPRCAEEGGGRGRAKGNPGRSNRGRAQDRAALIQMKDELEGTAGNFYINDKPTGAVVGQQPFGGARASGTNDKAGSLLNLLRWVSPRTIKEALVPPSDWRYPFLGEA